MPDWIVGLKKAAIEHRPGVDASGWAEAQREAGDEAPAELRALYSELNGATFASGVVLFPLRGQGDVKGMVEQNRSGNGGLPASGVWRFGRRDQEHLAAVRKGRLSEVQQAEGDAPPDWLDDVADDAWVYVARDESQDRLRVYRSLQQLLSSRIPPAESEEFGEPTLARASALVEAAVAELAGSTAQAVQDVANKLGVGNAKDRRRMRRAVQAHGLGQGTFVLEPPAKKAAASKRAPVKKAAAARKRAPVKKAAAARKRTPVKKATAARKRTPAKKAAVARKRTPAKKAAAAKKRAPVKKAAAAKKRAPAKKAAVAKKRTPAKKAAAAKKQAPVKKATAAKKRAPVKKVAAAKKRAPAKKAAVAKKRAPARKATRTK